MIFLENVNFLFSFGQDDGDGDGGFDGNDEEAAAPGGDFTQAGFPLSQDTTLGDSSQGFSFTNESGADQTMFAGDGLVAQPNKVRLNCGKVHAIIMIALHYFSPVKNGTFQLQVP